MKNFAAMQEAFARAFGSEYSSWYRDHYARIGFCAPETMDSLAVWRTIPTISKSDIVGVPFEKRLFVPLSDVDVIRTTSGTTGSGILCMPRVSPPSWRGAPTLFPDTHVLLFNYHMYRHLDAHGHFAKRDERGEPLRAIVGDPSDLPATATLARAARIGSIHGPPGTTLALAFHLGEYAERITDILLGTERCSTLQLDALARAYGAARIRFNYASADAQGIVGLSPDTPLSGHPRALHVLPHYFVEVVDEQGNAMPLGTSGEIVITLLRERVAFPLIRYRTGDRGVLLRDDEVQLMELEGRVGGERVRIPGGEIVLKHLEDAVAAAASHGAAADFEARIEEADVRGMPLPRLRIRLYASATSIDTETVARALSETLRVNQTRTYADGVREGIYAPLACEVARHTGHRKRLPLLDARA